MPPKNIPLSLGEKQLFLFDSEGILFCRRTNRLFYLNTTAAFLWCCFEEGLAPPAAADALSEQFGIPPRLAQKDLEASLADWRSRGLLEDPPAQIAESNVLEPKSHPASRRPFPVADAEPTREPPSAGPETQQKTSTQEQIDTIGTRDVLVASPDGVAHRYRAGNLHLQIWFSSSKSASLVHPILAHLAAGPTQDKESPATSLEITETDNTFALHRNGVKCTDAIRAIELASVVQREVLLTAFELSGCLVAIHAAAVSNGKRCLLMPAVPGSGKTSLTAALVSSGYTYLTDELVLLMPASHLIRPIPVSLGLKRGSWSVLKPRFPKLENLPVFRQPDGTEVRYLSPQENWLPDRDEYPVDKVVFPIYEPNGPTGLKRLSSAQALYRLAEAGYAVPGKLDSSVVSELIAWIRRMDCHELRVRDLTKAVSEVTELLA